MASTYSDLKIELIATGEQTGTWGNTTNNNFSIAVGEAITGSADVAFSSADVTITLTDTNGSQAARNLRLNLTGTSGGARQLILGSGCQIEKLYLINNGLADAVTVKNTSGTGTVVPAGTAMLVFNNGTNVVAAVTSTTDITATDITDSSLTSGRVTYAGAGGNLIDSANLTFNGTILTAGGVSTAAATITGGSINNTPIGASTASTGNFTTLASNGATTFTAGTASTSTTTGTAVITGGLGVSGRINAANFDGIVGANTAAAGNFTTLGATGVATFSAGTVSAPAITTTGDTNTGIFFPAADTIAFTEGSVEAMRIDSSGNVGIGTSSPGDKLEVNPAVRITGSTLAGGNLYLNNTQGTSFKSQITWLANSAAKYSIGVDPAATGTNAFYFYDEVAGSERMRIDSSGNVGIGTTSPTTALQVNGTVTATSFTGAGTGLTGTASSLSIGGNAATATNATTVTGATQNNITSIPNLATVGTITSGTWSGSFGAVSGANLITLNASNLSSGTVASARLSGTYGINISGNAATATNATNATNITNSGGWSVTPNSTKLFFNYNGTNVGSLDSSGNFIVIGNVTAYGTP